jgi:hypothetical protein
MNIDYPFHFDHTGRTAVTSDEDHIRDMIEQFLFTQAGERVNRPDFGGGMYSHGLATICICEAYGLTSDPVLKAPAQHAIDFIVKAQDPAGGGWRYAPRQSGDTSVVGWQVMALKSGQMSGLSVPVATFASPVRAGKDPVIAQRQITPDYFEATRTPIRRGRAFTAADTAQSLPVVIVNETTARRYWPGADPIGKHLANSRDKVQREVVGVAADVKFRSLDAPNVEEMYLPLAQSPWPSMTVLVRSDADPRPLVAAVRRELARLDPDIAVSGVQSLDEIVSGSVAQPQLVERSEDADVLERVRGVRVDGEQDVGVRLPDGADALHVGAGLDLELDALVSLGEVPLHLLEELLDGRRDADGDATGDAIAFRAEVLRERASGGAELRVEQCHLHRGLRHRMATDAGERIRELLGGDVRVEDPRSEMVAERDPRLLVELLRVLGLGARDALSPPLGVVGLQSQEDRVLRRVLPERGAERPDERQRDQAELENPDPGHPRPVPASEPVEK